MRRFDDDILLSPSDLNDLVECRHLIALKLARLRGEPTPQFHRGAHAEFLAAYGQRHEAAILDELERHGVQIAKIAGGPRQDDLRRARDETLEAMRMGADVI